MEKEYTPRTQAMLDEAYWPWPLALAYCQPIKGRAEAVEAVTEILEEYSASKHKELAPYKGSSAVARLYEVATGKSYGAEDSEQYWAAVAEIECPLLGTVKAGSLDAMGRPSPDAALMPIAVSDWVGGEVHPEATADLIAEGWRANDTLDQVLGDRERTVRFYDVHLLGAAVRQLARDLSSNDVMDETLADDYEALTKLEVEGERPNEGYWSPFVVGAWIGSRSESFVSAVQKYEREAMCARGGCYSAAAWLTIGNVMGERFDRTLTQSLDDLRLALERGEVPGGRAKSVHGSPRPVERYEWPEWRVAHNDGGVSILPGLVDFSWPSEEVRKAFPAELERRQDCQREKPQFTDDDLIAAVDALWVNGKSLRDAQGIVSKDPRFSGATLASVQFLTDGRYPRVGQGGLAARKDALKRLQEV